MKTDPANMLLETSISDNGVYPAFCASAAADDAVFQAFKSHPSYTPILEHVTPEEGMKYLNIILSGDGVLEGLLEKFKENDRYGSPPLVEYGAYGKFSPTTLRYIKILHDLRKHFGDLSGKHIVEIGGGYGGQCQIITSFFNVASYTIYDLEPVTALVRKYWEKNRVRANVKALPFSKLEAGVPCDLVISNYAFSECIEEVREMYLEKLVSRAPAGYMICNFETPELRANIVRRIPGAKTVAEKPLTAPHNFTLVWGHRPIAAVTEYQRSVVSQHGEDGILEEIFCRIGSGGKRCVEFGAYDGVCISNTWKLWALEGWSAMLIEAYEEYFQKLAQNTRDFPAVRIQHAFVTAEPGALDALLEPWARGQKIDLISIDIDSDDYHIFLGLEKYLPRVLVIEYNPTIPEQFLVVPGAGEMVGTSARAVNFLAAKKGYTLVAMTPTNMIFVENGEFSKLGMERPLLEDLFPEDHLTYLMTAYTSLLFASQSPPYSGFDMKPYRRPVPKFADPHPWTPVQLVGLDVARSRERATLTPFWAKQRLVHDYAELHLIDRFIETGTGEKMAGSCREYFRRSDQVAPGALENFLRTLSEPAIFWINNPFTPGAPDLARTEEIHEELKMILEHPVKGHVVLIDHARLFNGEDGYPHVDRFEEDSRARRPGYIFHIREDILRVYPPVFPSLKKRAWKKILQKMALPAKEPKEAQTELTPHQRKQRVLWAYADLFSIDDLIETGTYAGEMIDACKDFFRSIISIELSRPHYQEAVERFSGLKHVRLCCGDSGEALPEILRSVKKPCLFWLDGHYSGDTTAKGELNTPILKELDAILRHPIQGHVILIDDARCFGVEEDYPPLSELEARVRQQRPDLVWSVRNDIIRIHRPLPAPSLKKRIWRKLVHKIRSRNRR